MERLRASAKASQLAAQRNGKGRRARRCESGDIPFELQPHGALSPPTFEGSTPAANGATRDAHVVSTPRIRRRPRRAAPRRTPRDARALRDGADARAGVTRRYAFERPLSWLMRAATVISRYSVVSEFSS